MITQCIWSWWVNNGWKSHKIEFQDRGAGHIHGTLWLKLENIERLIWTDENQLILDDAEYENDDKQHDGTSLDKDENINNPNRPFKGIVSAFRVREGSIEKFHW